MEIVRIDVLGLVEFTNDTMLGLPLQARDADVVAFDKLADPVETSLKNARGWFAKAVDQFERPKLFGVESFEEIRKLSRAGLGHIANGQRFQL